MSIEILLHSSNPARADETSLTLFNTTSDQSTTYPMFLSSALLPKGIRRKPGNLVNVALLPKFLKRLHPGLSSQKNAHLKRLLVWPSLRAVLQPLIEPDEEGPVPGYWCVMLLRMFASCELCSHASRLSSSVTLIVTCSYQGDYVLFGEHQKRRVFLALLLYLGG